MTPKVLVSLPPVGGDKYILAIDRAGGESIAAYCPDLNTSADALLLTGGGDIHPDLLGEPDQGSREIDLPRDQVELALVERFLGEGKPIFGICRGHQVLHVALGGALIQDLPSSLARFHEPAAGTEIDRVHSVATSPGSLMAQIYGNLALVNSWHHQSVDRPGKGLRTTAWTESGLLEASEHESLPILSVQFHPERMGNGLADGDGLFRQFLAWCQPR